MKEEIRVLIVEHIPEDIELMRRELDKADLNCCSKVVQSEDELKALLSECTPDIVLSDYYIPGLDLKSVISAVKGKDPAVPIIVVSGWIAEEKVLECIEDGAAEYVSKAQLSRLIPVIKSMLKI